MVQRISTLEADVTGLNTLLQLSAAKHSTAEYDLRMRVQSVSEQPKC